QGLGLEPLTVRFWADVEFFDPSGTKAVRFEIVQGSDVLAAKTTAARQAVVAGDPIYGFSNYTADFNVNDLPPGDLTLRITPLLGGLPVAPHDYTIRMTDLARRWFTDAIGNPTVTISAAASDDLVYTFTGNLPKPAFAFDQSIASLENTVDLSIP